MPELPELEVIRDVLRRRVVGARIAAVESVPPGSAIVVRDLTQRGFAAALTGARIEAVARRGKFLIFSLERGGPFYLTINPKLAGRLQLCAPGDKRLPKTDIVFTLEQPGASQGSDCLSLRYVDPRQMGQVYLSDAPPEVAGVPDFAGLGPEPFDLTREAFSARLRPFRGEIKGVLTRGECVAGIGNAYADEILWAARIHPYRKRTSLKPDEVERLYGAMREVLADAVAQVRAAMGESIHLEPRAFLKVHMRTGQPCPRCGAPIAMVGANQRVTNFCRSCQPGGLIRGM